MASSKVIVCGTRKDTEFLVHKVVNYEALTAGRECKAFGEVAVDCGNNDFSAKLSIQNKYFDADLVCHGVSTKEEDDAHVDAAEYEGTIIVVPAEEQFLGSSKLATLGASCNETGHEFKAFVLLKSDSTETDPALDNQSTMEWCLDHGFEYIEVDISDLIAGWQDREKDGLPRLMEAINSVMWSSCRRKSSPAAVAQSASSAASTSAASAESKLSDAPSAEAKLSCACAANATEDNGTCQGDVSLEVNREESSITISEVDLQNEDETEKAIDRMSEMMQQVRLYVDATYCTQVLLVCPNSHA
jgi:hypothetical protein